MIALFVLYWAYILHNKMDVSTMILFCSELQFYGKQRRAERFAWLAGPGIYHGHLNLGTTSRLGSPPISLVI